MNVSTLLPLFFALTFGFCVCYCPPLLAPETTELICEEPSKHQRMNCSTSWLPEGTVAYFKCMTDFKKRAKGRIVCSEGGIHRHIQKQSITNKSDINLPCGIERDLEKSDIHIYGYQAPIRYNFTNKAIAAFDKLGEALHNEFRNTHGTPPLQLQANLSKLAQDWADKVSVTGRIDMASNLTYGQNVFLAEGTNLTAAVNDAVQNWYYKGLADYCWEDATENWSNSLILAFSQVVWKSSRHLGIGAAPLKSRNATAIIALYDPSGNLIIDGDEDASEKLFESNVLQANDNL